MENRLADLEASLPNLISKTLSTLLYKDIDKYLEKSLMISCITAEIDRHFQINQKEISSSEEAVKGNEIRLRDTLYKLQSFEIEIEHVHDKFTELTQKIEERAYTEDIKKLRKEMNDLCPLKFAYQIEDELRTKAPNTDVNKLLDKINAIKQAFNTDFYTKEKAEEDFETHQNIVDEKLTKYTTQEDLSTKLDEIMKTNSDLQDEINKLRGKTTIENGQLNQYINSIKSELNLKMSRSDLEMLTTRLNTKASTNDMESGFANVKNHVATLHKRIEGQFELLEHQESTLVRLDELILDKASKLDFRNLGDKVSAVLKHVDLENKIDQMVENQGKLAEFASQAKIHIDQVDRKIDEISHLYHKRAQESLELQLIKDSIVDMSTDLSYKTDRSEYFQQLEGKASFREIKILKKAIETIHKNSKLIVVQMNALIKMINDPAKVKGYDRVQKEIVGKNTQKVVNFIMKTKPLKQTMLPEDLESLITPRLVADGNRVQSARLRTASSRRGYLNRSSEIIIKDKF